MTLAKSERLSPTSYLIENGVVRAQKAPLDISLAQTDVKHLAIGLTVGVVTIWAAFAAESEVRRYRIQLLTPCPKSWKLTLLLQICAGSTKLHECVYVGIPDRSRMCDCGTVRRCWQGIARYFFLATDTILFSKKRRDSQMTLFYRQTKAGRYSMQNMILWSSLSNADSAAKIVRYHCRFATFSNNQRGGGQLLVCYSLLPSPSALAFSYWTKHEVW